MRKLVESGNKDEVVKLIIDVFVLLFGLEVVE